VHSERTISILIDLIYEAAGDKSRWPAFLEAFGQAVHSSGNTMFVQNLHSHELDS